MAWFCSNGLSSCPGIPPQWVCLQFSNKTNRGPQWLYFKKYFSLGGLSVRKLIKGAGRRAHWVADHCWDLGGLGRHGKETGGSWQVFLVPSFPPLHKGGFGLPSGSQQLCLCNASDHVKRLSTVLLDHVWYPGHFLYAVSPGPSTASRSHLTYGTPSYACSWTPRAQAPPRAAGALWFLRAESQQVSVLQMGPPQFIKKYYHELRPGSECSYRKPLIDQGADIVCDKSHSEKSLISDWHMSFIPHTFFFPVHIRIYTATQKPKEVHCNLAVKHPGISSLPPG